jgi:hypothetical protein
MGWWTSVLSDWQKNNKKSHESVPVMSKNLLAGAKNTLSHCHTGQKCRTGTNSKIKQDISQGWTSCPSG